MEIKYTVTLNKLNKLIAENKEPGSKVFRFAGTGESFSFDMSPNRFLYGEYDDYVAFVNKSFTDNLLKYKMAQIKKISLIRLKSILFTENMKSGVHDRLTEIACQQVYLTTSEKFAEHEQPTLLKKEEFNSLKEATQKNQASVIPTVGHAIPLNPQSAKEVVKKTKAIISKLKDELAVINATHTVEITLDSEIAEEFGMEV